jgi:hypothetical protein
MPARWKRRIERPHARAVEPEELDGLVTAVRDREYRGLLGRLRWVPRLLLTAPPFAELRAARHAPGAPLIDGTDERKLRIERVSYRGGLIKSLDTMKLSEPPKRINPCDARECIR